MEISTTPNEHPVPDERLAEILAEPGFGTHFADHMFTVEWTPDAGWHDARITPYGPLTLDPATAVLHYAQETFEGMKAYRRDDGSVWTFRPDQNAARMVRSSQRLAFPELPVDDFVELVDALVTVDQRWVPDNSSGGGGEKALYLRPFMFASETFLGVRPAQHVTFLVIASPAGAYFKGGIKPVSVWLSTEYVRACPGGTGAAKFGGNYAASLLAQAQAADNDCDQVVWLDAAERRYVEEMGGMNLFFVFRDGEGHKLVTPKLTGTLLAGVTRDSLLKLAPELGYPIEERMISVDDWKQGQKNGAIVEVFACGTAAVITPVGEVKFDGGSFRINEGEFGPVARRLRESLLSIQYGKSPDPHGWLHRVP
jgi:branched-chain amino acid aminotransferase